MFSSLLRSGVEKSTNPYSQPSVFSTQFTMKSTTFVVALLASANSALAHYRWTNLVANGSTTADYYYVRENTNYNSPVTNVSSTDIRCNTGTQASAATTHIGTVSAGSIVGLALDQAIYHAGVTGSLLAHAES